MPELRATGPQRRGPVAGHEGVDPGGVVVEQAVIGWLRRRVVGDEAAAQPGVVGRRRCCLRPTDRRGHFGEAVDADGRRRFVPSTASSHSATAPSAKSTAPSSDGASRPSRSGRPVRYARISRCQIVPGCRVLRRRPVLGTVAAWRDHLAYGATTVPGHPVDRSSDGVQRIVVQGRHLKLVAVDQAQRSGLGRSVVEIVLGGAGRLVGFHGVAFSVRCDLSTGGCGRRWRVSAIAA